MDIPKESKPKVRHSNIKNEVNKFRKVWKAFSNEVASEFANKSRLERKKEWDLSTGENLLNMRRELRDRVKEGVLERKNQEQDIAMYACFVWFCRLEKEKRDRISDLW